MPVGNHALFFQLPSYYHDEKYRNQDFPEFSIKSEISETFESIFLSSI